MSIHERFAPSNEAHEIPLIEEFVECCWQHAWFFSEGWISLQTAVDNLQAMAGRWGLVDSHGQEDVQGIMGAAFRFAREG
jgi:hypothetical protein